MRRRLLLIICIVALNLNLWAKNVEHEDILHLNYGGIWMQDQYLSPLLYSGMQVGIGNEWWQTFRCDSNWAHVGRVDARFEWMYSSAGNNLVYAIGLQTGWGGYRLLNIGHSGVQLLVGPYLDVDFMPKYHAREVNKPYSMDLGVDVELMGGVRYHWHNDKVALRLNYLIRVNGIGVDFMPDYWESYYELSKGIAGKVRCSGLWNRRVLRHELTLDIAGQHSTWRIGIQHQYLEYGQQNMWFSREQVELIVGTCFKYKLKGKTL